ncbi:hypothetical protein AABM27_03505 [Heyndrickxia faecalis]|jgi:chloramphenicol O-acetyltransferase|uniref:hypothetical protein n=1 Tax=Heyndrickxia TaxID=2837504 RepID=UPI002F3BF621
MLRPIRKTLTGQVEYWDTEKKLVVVGSASSETVETVDTETDVMDFSKMTVAELKQFAADNQIELPDDIKKKDDIIRFLTDDAE